MNIIFNDVFFFVGKFQPKATEFNTFISLRLSKLIKQVYVANQTVVKLLSAISQNCLLEDAFIISLVPELRLFKIPKIQSIEITQRVVYTLQLTIILSHHCKSIFEFDLSFMVIIFQAISFIVHEKNLLQPVLVNSSDEPVEMLGIDLESSFCSMFNATVCRLLLGFGLTNFIFFFGRNVLDFNEFSDWILHLLEDCF